MKKLFAAFFIMAILPAMAFSQFTDWQKAINQVSVPFKAPQLKTDMPELSTPKKAIDMPMAYSVVDTVRDATFSFYGVLSPFAYEQESKTLIMAQTYRIQKSQTAPLTGSVYIKYSKNDGQTWTKSNLYEQDNIIPVWPSLCVLNPNKVTDPTQFSYMITSVLAKNDGNGSYPWVGDQFLLVDPSLGTNAAEYFGPGGNTLQRWFWVMTASSTNGGKQMMYNAGTLSNTAGQQYGHYGFTSFDLGNGDFSNSKTPPQWSVDKFRPSTNLNSSYNEHCGIDVDSKGVVYMGVKNIFADDINNRLPATSKSTDFGKTWQDFEKFPVALMTNYATVMGGDPTKASIIPYAQDGFNVYGDNNYSFFFRYYFTTADGSANEFHLVEVYNKNGSWGIRKVGDWSGFLPVYMTNEGSQTAWKDSLSTSSLGHELQLARTVDNKYIIAKWIDYTGKSITVAPSIVTGGGDTISAVNVTDVFMSYKDVNGNAWSNPVNVTNDDIINKCSQIPSVVPDLSHVPLLSYASMKTNYTDPTNPRLKYPDAVWQLIIDSWQGVFYSSVDLVNGTKVNEQPTISFTVNDIYPNPASDKAELVFNTDAYANVNIELYNILGQKVKTIYNENLESGIHGLNINTSDVDAGSYFVKITVGSNTVSRTLNVIR